MCTCSSTNNYTVCSVGTMCLTQLHNSIPDFRKIHSMEHMKYTPHYGLSGYRIAQQCFVTSLKYSDQTTNNLQISCKNIKDLLFFQFLVITSGSHLAGDKHSHRPLKGDTPPSQQNTILQKFSIFLIIQVTTVKLRPFYQSHKDL